MITKFKTLEQGNFHVLRHQGDDADIDTISTLQHW